MGIRQTNSGHSASTFKKGGKNLKARTISYVALFTALTAIGAFIKIPIPYIPFTLQILAVYLAGALLGPRLECSVSYATS